MPLCCGYWGYVYFVDVWFDSCICLFALVGFAWLLRFCVDLWVVVLFDRGVFCRLLVGIFRLCWGMFGEVLFSLLCMCCERVCEWVGLIIMLVGK